MKLLFAYYLKAKLSDFCVLSDFDYKKIIYDWNQTERPYPTNKMIHQLFEEQVEKTPNNIALIYKDKPLTYQELQI